MAKKDKKKVAETPAPEVQEEVLVTTELEPEPEEIQFTDTSYSSASFESLPPLPVEVEKKDKKKKKKKLDDKESAQIKKSASEINWSEESLPVIDSDEVVIKPEEPVEQKPKKGKGKKGKEKEEIPEFEKPKEWKTMNRKDRENWMTARIEQWRAEKEAEKQAILAGAKEKRLAYARERNEQLARDVNDQDIRRDILQKTCTLFHRYEREKIVEMQKKQADEEWEQHLRCDGLPDPRVVPQIQTYLHLWEHLTVVNAEELDKRCIEVLPMLEMLEQLVQKTKQFTPRQINNYNEIRLALRAQLSETIQLASYFLLRDLEKYLKMESTKLATYEKTFNGLRLNIWVAIKQPTRKRKPVEPEPVPVQLSFPALKVTVTLPKIIDGSCVCVRAARSMIDLLSESSRSFSTTAVLPNKDVDLFDFNEKELQDMIVTKKQQDDMRAKFFKAIREKTYELERFLKANPYTKNEKEKEELDNLNMQEPPPVEEPRQCQVTINEKAFKKYLKGCRSRTRIGEINLRKYRICGGTLNLDLITTPPQPKYMMYSVILTACEYF
ncbi:unnamed protein product [Arctia plantaginis]|uniref:IC97/Casc1 N-terminal domain-containing protein n=1 Tax=Arctia plantaginis TaxID=874455 RepID=A0A8S1B4C2_ARCPL|nr:unnamed protein product [Arctia plantaginis]CAB3257423.1 unnamed protein product [Arctia plantaginis]